jgi:hypothetical protein
MRIKLGVNRLDQNRAQFPIVGARETGVILNPLRVKDPQARAVGPFALWGPFRQEPSG